MTVVMVVFAAPAEVDDVMDFCAILTMFGVAIVPVVAFRAHNLSGIVGGSRNSTK